MSGMHAKTALGTHEITARKIKMPPRLRMMLILVDGESPDAKLAGEAQKIGAPPDSLAQLRQLGLIEPVGELAQDAAPPARMTPPERFRAGKELMTASASSFMG